MRCRYQPNMYVFWRQMSSELMEFGQELTVCSHNCKHGDEEPEIQFLKHGIDITEVNAHYTDLGYRHC